MIEKLRNLEAKFTPLLREGDYMFIGPELNDPIFDNFIKTVNLKAPVKGFTRSIHDALSHKNSVNATLELLPENKPLRIYVVISPAAAPDGLFHSTIEEYCKRFDIKFDENL